jgi:hypothetical protein
LQATVTAAAETRHHLDAIQSGYQMALHPPFIKSLAAFQAAVAIHQQGFQWGQVEAAQTVAQGIIMNAPLDADLLLQIGM